MSSLSVLILTKNEEINIAEAIRSARQCTDDIIVVDSGSTDGTVAIAKSLGARVCFRAWDGDFAAQRNFSALQSDAQWVLFMDADERISPELARAIKKTVTGFPGVHGAYDLVLNNYGPDDWNGSIHIEVPDTCSANDLDLLIRSIQTAVYAEHHVILTAIGVYSMNTRDADVIETCSKVREIVFSHEYVRQMHGFYLLKEEKAMRFDVVVSFDAPDRRAVYREILADVQKAFPDYQLQIALDTDFSEE